jgi:hypothetical protein
MKLEKTFSVKSVKNARCWQALWEGPQARREDAINLHSRKRSRLQGGDDCSSKLHFSCNDDELDEE